MTKISKPINVLYIANILKKSIQLQIQGYEKSILQGPDDSFTSLCRTMKGLEESKLKATQYLIEFLKSEQKTNANIQKIMQDADPDGVVYCMKCGEDV